MSRDYRSPQAQAYRALYKTARWRRLREHQLRAHPLCRMCAKTGGRITPATVVDHIKDHKGDETKFWNPANLQSLCAPHHDGAKQKETIAGFSGEADDTGWPSDPRHPANQRR